MQSEKSAGKTSWVGEEGTSPEGGLLVGKGGQSCDVPDRVLAAFLYFLTIGHTQTQRLWLQEDKAAVYCGSTVGHRQPVYPPLAAQGIGTIGILWSQSVLRDLVFLTPHGMGSSLA